MKSIRLSDHNRALRREMIMEKRGNAILQHSGGRYGMRSVVQYHTTAFATVCGKRQRARYAQQLAAGQIRLQTVNQPSAPAAKPKRTRSKPVRSA